MVYSYTKLIPALWAARLDEDVHRRGSLRFDCVISILSGLAMLIIWKDAPAVYYERLQPVLRAERRLEREEVYRVLCQGE